jgi:hypothetical protein
VSIRPQATLQPAAPGLRSFQFTAKMLVLKQRLIKIKGKSMATTTTNNQSENIGKGLLLASLAIPIGIALWVIIWRAGYMASLVSFIIAFLAVWLYKKGAGAGPSKKSAPLIVGLVVAGVLLAFVGGMVSDAADFIVQQNSDTDALSLLLSPDFWAFFSENIFANGELWASYTTDILIAVGFGALGSFFVLKEALFGAPKPAAKKAKA